MVIIDSIQTLQTEYIESSPGSVSQIKECTAELIQFAKRTHTPVILVGHITKDGNIAGPKVMEHMVDTVLHFEGDRNHIYRILRAQKTVSVPQPRLEFTRCNPGTAWGEQPE